MSDQEFEALLTISTDIEKLSPDDTLSRFVWKILKNGELDEIELDNVAAAAKPDYGKFLARLDTLGLA